MMKTYDENQAEIHGLTPAEYENHCATLDEIADEKIICDPWEEGYDAAYMSRRRDPIPANPYVYATARYHSWDDGYACGQRDRMEEMI